MTLPVHQLGTPWKCKHCGRAFETRAAMYAHFGKCLRKKRHNIEKVSGFTVRGYSIRYLVIPLQSNSKQGLTKCIEDIRIEDGVSEDEKDNALYLVLATAARFKKITYKEISIEEHEKLSLNCYGLSIESKWTQQP